MSTLTRPMVTIGSSFLAAAFAVSFCASETAWIGAIVFAILLIASLALLRFRRSQYAAVLTAIFASVLAACVSWGFYRSACSFDFSSLAGEKHTFTGIVRQTGVSSGGSVSLRLDVTKHDIPAYDGTNAPKSFTALLYTGTDWGCEAGDELTVEATCLSMEGTPSFDSRRYYEGQGINLTLYAYGDASIRAPKFRPPTAYFQRFSNTLRETADRVFSPNTAALVKAVLLGDDSGISSAQYRAFSIAGVTHIFVVSGLHVSLMAGVLLSLLRRLRLSDRLSSILAAVGVWGFVALTGFGLPAVRAGIMLTVLLAGRLFRRPADGLNSLLTAGVLIVLFQPYSIISGSFQLSFAATFGAIQFSRPIAAWIRERLHLREKGTGDFLAKTVSLSIGCNLAMLPVALWLFRGVSIVFPLTNLLSIPFLPITLVCSLLALLFPGIPILTTILSSLAELPLILVTGVSTLVAKIPYSYLGLNDPAVPLWIICALVLLGLTYGFCRREERTVRVRRFTQMACLMIGGLVLILVAGKIKNRDTVTVETVATFGAQSVVFTYQGGATAIVLGNDGQIGKELETCLRSRNIRRIDNLVLAYGNTGEAEDIRFLADAIPVQNVLLFAEDEFAPYAGNVLHPQNGTFLLREGHGFDLLPLGENGLIELFRSSEGVTVTAAVGDFAAVVAQEDSTELHPNCEFLFTTPENANFLRQTGVKYVILLEKPAEDFAGSVTGCIPAYCERVRLLFDMQGNYRFHVGGAW